MQFAAPFSARPRRTAGPPDRPVRPLRELLAVLVVLAGYFGLRVVVEGDRATAVRNAERLLELEARLGIDVERDVQSVVLDHGVISSALSWSYVWLHWPLLIVAMLFLTFRAPAVQARFRTALLLSATVGVVLFATIPMAPPRFMPGFVGTVSDAARRHYLPYSLDWTNQFAAFPSYHVGWTLVACLAVAGVVASRWRWLLAVPATLVAVAVVGTGNHYVLDSATGAVLALAAWWLAGRWDASVGHREDGDGAAVAVDADVGTVRDPRRGTSGGHDAGPPELARHDDGVAHLAADVDHHRLDRHEQRCP